MIKRGDERARRLAQLKKEATRRDFDRHVSVLKDVASLPPELQSSAVTEQTAGLSIHTLLSFPPQVHRGWEYIPRQGLVFTPGGVIHLLASIWPGQGPEITRLDGQDLLYLHATLLLLYGRLEIVARGDGRPTHLDMEFNTVAWSYLSPPLQRLLLNAREARGAVLAQAMFSAGIQQAYAQLPLKFANGLKIYGLLPGEQVEELVFQPGIWKQRFLILQRPVAANVLLLLTSNYLVVIQEDLKVRQGWILSYLPRAGIQAIGARPGESQEEVIVWLKRGEQTAEYTLALTAATTAAWRTAWTRHGGQWWQNPPAG
ncbi:MAG: hypothetical protein GYA17_03965 [Chloroflexi bacterium]|nr:hypothetical protein [Chloroflexota bacterium]